MIRGSMKRAVSQHREEEIDVTKHHRRTIHFTLQQWTRCHGGRSVFSARL